MRSKEQTEAITNLQECRDSTRRISFQSHGQPMQTFENGCGRTKNTDFEPLHEKSPVHGTGDLTSFLSPLHQFVHFFFQPPHDLLFQTGNIGLGDT